MNIHRRLLYTLCFASIVFLSCNTVPSKVDHNNEAITSTIDTLEALETLDTTLTKLGNQMTGLDEDFMQTVYLVIANTGFDYSKLQRKMVSLSQKINVPIDSMNRYYNSNHDLIMLPDSMEDELYGTYYFMRRYPSETMSIEYLDHYDTSAAEKHYVVVAGLYESKTKADSLLKVVSPFTKDAYILSTDIFFGCMH